MNNSKKNQSVLFIVLISVMSFVLFLNMAVFAGRVISKLVGGGYANEYSDLRRAVEHSDYPDVSNMLSSNERWEARPMEDLSEFRLLQEYYNLSMRYNALAKLGLGESGTAAELWERMQALRGDAVDSVILEGMEDLQQRLVE